MDFCSLAKGCAARLGPRVERPLHVFASPALSEDGDFDMDMETVILFIHTGYLPGLYTTNECTQSTLDCADVYGEIK